MRRTAIALAAVLAAGCAAGPAPPGSAERVPAMTSAVPAVPPVPGIEAEAVRLRTDRAVGGQVQVRVTATGEESFTVIAVALDSPGFAPLPAREVTAQFVPGRTIDLPAPYGDPVCGAAPEPAAARLTVARPDGVPEDLRVPLAAEVLTLIHTEECAVEAVLEVVRIAVTGLAGAGDAVTGRLVLTRAGDDRRPVTVTDLRGSVVYGAAVGGLPLELRRDEDEVSSTVSFRAVSCDPHVLADTKQPYVFPLQVVVGGAEPVAVDLPLDEQQRGVLADLVDRTCGTGA
ncbi:MAG TPA: hypothetical protein VHF92_16725 [Geodermatophilus sp.]|nr:hypothetical protein [Geodermatophilus sp.]